MSSETIARATEPFFTTKGANAGTGLGLSMVELFAQQSGGLLEIGSRVDRGTRVRLILPVLEKADPALMTAGRSDDEQRGIPLLSSRDA